MTYSTWLYASLPATAEDDGCYVSCTTEIALVFRVLSECLWLLSRKFSKIFHVFLVKSQFSCGQLFLEKPAAKTRCWRSFSTYSALFLRNFTCPNSLFFFLLLRYYSSGSQSYLLKSGKTKNVVFVTISLALCSIKFCLCFWKKGPI